MKVMVQYLTRLWDHKTNFAYILYLKIIQLTVENRKK